jgi:predicted dehydrogenase
MLITVVGPGLIGKTHISLIGVRADVSLASIVAPLREKNRAFAASLGVPLYESLAESIAKSRPDAVIIASPNEFHFEQAETCILNKIPVLVEKPMTVSLSEAAALKRLASINNVPVLVGHHRTHSETIKLAQSIVSSGRLGALVSILASAQFLKPTSYFDAGPWRKEIGGGPILINLIHEIGLFRSIVGDIETVSALASNARRQFPVEDTAIISFKFTCGALGTLVLSDIAASNKSWEHTAGENKAFPKYFDDCYVLSGTEASLAMPSMRLLCYPPDVERSWTTRQVEVQLDVRTVDPLALQLEHFIDVVLNGASPRVSAEDGYKNMLVLECVRESIASKCSVEVAEMHRRALAS